MVLTLIVLTGNNTDVKYREDAASLTSLEAGNLVWKIDARTDTRFWELLNIGGMIDLDLQTSNQSIYVVSATKAEVLAGGTGGAKSNGPTNIVDSSSRRISVSNLQKIWHQVSRGVKAGCGRHTKTLHRHSS